MTIASSTDFGANLGIGLRFGGGENSRVGFRIDLEDYLYNGDFGGGDDFQNDLVASVGRLDRARRQRQQRLVQAGPVRSRGVSPGFPGDTPLGTSSLIASVVQAPTGWRSLPAAAA